MAPHWHGIIPIPFFKNFSETLFGVKRSTVQQLHVLYFICLHSDGLSRSQTYDFPFCHRLGPIDEGVGGETGSRRLAAVSQRHLLTVFAAPGSPVRVGTEVRLGIWGILSSLILCEPQHGPPITITLCLLKEFGKREGLGERR
jgi:hypothetical protein